MNYKPTNIFLFNNLKLRFNMGTPYFEVKLYCRIVKKLIDLQISEPNISHVVSMTNKYMSNL
jgi:hypothetical protein